ncbi:MAG: putative nuclease, contains PIN domain, potential toxin-antitoxin system component [Chloroflexi bacterium]|jgi:predicted nuclease of predicted toxin-antitoxin system|nr:MAG: putative nuclease, contains PIN domain, potential toxin-antitoxin system component [Chloroflexota bacterium]
MKLLFDQNLSPRLVHSLSDLYPGSSHVREVGLASAVDSQAWEYAKGDGFVIVSKDSDFRQLSFATSQPPKVVWIGRGNCSTADIEAILRSRHLDLLPFEKDQESSFLALR